MKSKKKEKRKIKITPSTIVGGVIGLLMIVAGIYTVITSGGYAGYYFAVLGMCFIILIVVILLTRR